MLRGNDRAQAAVAALKMERRSSVTACSLRPTHPPTTHVIDETLEGRGCVTAWACMRLARQHHFDGNCAYVTQ